jgi:hypothetical protein
VIDETFRILELRAVTGVRIQHQLGVPEMFEGNMRSGQEDGVVTPALTL